MLYRVVQMYFTPEIEVQYFVSYSIDLFLFLQCHLSNCINNTLISLVKVSWAILMYFELKNGPKMRPNMTPKRPQEHGKML